MLLNRAGIDELAPWFSGVDRVLDRNEAVPDFDYYIHLMSLPRVFGIDVDSVPAEVPYLRVDPERAARWANRFADDDKLKVGIVWAGSPDHGRDHFRSINGEGAIFSGPG